MILADGRMINRFYGKNLIRDETVEELEKWVKAEEKAKGTLKHSSSTSEACQKIRAFED